ncbi:hypothetical protein HDU76_003015, partial [Blyttiomyces sp. JEL0837]
FVVTELVKNSMQAVSSHSQSQSQQDSKPAQPTGDVRITIGFSKQNMLTIRVSDSGGGLDVKVSDEDGLWCFGKGNGFLGLPMTKVYAQFWGGDVGLCSMRGFGTDAYFSVNVGGELVEHLGYCGRVGVAEGLSGGDNEDEF